MPIYEYRCNRCNKEFSELIIHSKEPRSVKCKFCQSGNLTRLISSFRIHQTEGSRITSLDTSRLHGDSYYKDSRNIGLRAKKRLKEMGVDLGTKMDEIIEKGRTGKILDEYSK